MTVCGSPLNDRLSPMSRVTVEPAAPQLLTDERDLRAVGQVSLRRERPTENDGCAEQTKVVSRRLFPLQLLWEVTTGEV